MDLIHPHGMERMRVPFRTRQERVTPDDDRLRLPYVPMLSEDTACGGAPIPCVGHLTGLDDDVGALEAREDGHGGCL